jgi:hypothetical protein
MCGLRLSEHAVHAWDLAVMLDPSATVLGDAVALLVDVLPMRVARLGTAATDPIRLAVTTQHPKRHLVLDTGGVSLEPSPGQSNGVAAGRGEAASDPTGGASIELDAEALLRLVYGRLDPAHTPPLQLEGVALDDLRAVFQPGGGR